MAETLIVVGLRRGRLYTQIVAINRLGQALRDIPCPTQRAQADILSAMLALIEEARTNTEAEYAALVDATPAPP